MKKLTLGLVAAGVMSLSAVANAQSSAFDGAYGQVGIGYQSISPSSSNVVEIAGGNTFNGNTPSVNSSNFTGTVTIGYTAPISGQFLLGIGAEYSPIAGSTTNTTTNYSGGSGTGTYQVQNSYNIFLAPAIAIDKDKLAYAKVGYTGASIKTQSTTAGDTAGSTTTNLNGFSLGLGYKQINSGGLYGFIEGNYFNYVNTSVNSSGNIGGTAYTLNYNVSANAYNVLAGIGYKF
jgi:hypothetical protein